MPDEKDALQIQIEKARMALPADTRAAIDAVDWREVIMQIRNKEGYDFIQLGELETETELLLCGLANPEDYPRQIEKGMGVSREAAQKLVSEMNEKVFKKIKEELIKITENKKLAAEKAEPRPVDVEKPLKEGLGKAGIQITEASASANGNTQALESREEILKRLERPELNSPLEESPTRLAGAVGEAQEGEVESYPPRLSATPQEGNTHPLLAQKLSGPMQITSSKTVHSLDNLTKPPLPAAGIPAPAVSSAPQKYSEDPYREKPE